MSKKKTNKLFVIIMISTIFLVITGITIAIIILNNSTNIFKSKGIASIEVIYYQDGVRVNPNNLIQSVINGGGSYDSIQFSMTLVNNGQVPFEDLKITSLNIESAEGTNRGYITWNTPAGTPVYINNNYYQTVGNLGVGESKILTSQIFAVSTLENFAQPIGFYILGQAKNTYKGNITTFNSSKISLTITPSIAPGTVIGSYPIPFPKWIEFDGTNMWVGGTNDIYKITPSGIITNYEFSTSDLEFDGTNMWVSSGYCLKKINLNGQIIWSDCLSSSSGNLDMKFDGTNMWVSSYDNYKIVKIFPNGSKTYFNINFKPRMIEFDGTNMWVTHPDNNGVSKITPSGIITSYFGTGNSPRGIAFDGTNMWTGNGGSISKITPSGIITTYSDIGAEWDIAFDGTNMWTTTSQKAMSKVNINNGNATIYPDIGIGLRDLAFDGTNMWATDYGAGKVLKIAI